MDERIAYCIDAELQFARTKFPGSNLNFAALVEEVGELAKALLDHSYGKAEAKDVYAEAIQVATMAIRVAEEGSAEFPYAFEHSHYQQFNASKLWKYQSETILADDYPVFAGFLYVVDGKPMASEVSGTVAHLKSKLNAKEVRRCAIASRASDEAAQKISAANNLSSSL